MENRKLAIVTGGSKGLGATLCSRFLDIGYQVVEFSRSGTTYYTIRVDLANPEEAEKTFTASLTKLAANEYDNIVAVNNAGVLSPIGHVGRKSTADILGNININFVSQIFFIRSFLQHFHEHHCKKTLVNISSGAALKGYSGWSLYCAAKAGIENFIRSVAIEQTTEKYPITAFSIDPHIMDTDMQALIRNTPLSDFPDRQRFIDFKNSGVLRQPSSVADMIIATIDHGYAGGERLILAECSNSRSHLIIARFTGAKRA